jgi:hypothetical protein
MKNNLTPFICVLFALTLSACDTYKEESRMVGIGDIDLLTYDFNVAMPSDLPLTIRVDPGSNPKELRVVPLKRDSLSISIYDTEGKLRNKINYQFVSGPLIARLREVRHLLENVKGLTIEIVGNYIVFGGKLIDPNDTERVLQVQAAYVDHILNLAIDSQNLCKTRICREDPPPLPDLALALQKIVEDVPDEKTKAPLAEKPKSEVKKKAPKGRAN